MFLEKGTEKISGKNIMKWTEINNALMKDPHVSLC